MNIVLNIIQETSIQQSPLLDISIEVHLQAFCDSQSWTNHSCLKLTQLNINFLNQKYTSKNGLQKMQCLFMFW